jgi:hypothetical protein
MAGICAPRVASDMKNKLLKQITLNLTAVSLFILLGACTTTTTPYASNRPLTAYRDSSGPVRGPDIIDGGTRIPVETYYDFPPIGDQGSR